MQHTVQAYHGMIVAPHRLAAEAGLRILRKGGNAVEAAIATAATLCVVYPHMTGLGGDAFWLILPAGSAGQTNLRSSTIAPVVIDACGRSACRASLDWYTAKGLGALPRRGPLAALTMAGAVSGWEAALTIAADWSKPSLPHSLADLFADAVALAEEGFPVSSMQSATTGRYLCELSATLGFSEQFLLQGKAPAPGARMRLPALAATFRRLAEEGLSDFYQGTLARDLASQLEAAGSPLGLEDFTAHQARIIPPLRLDLAEATLFNSPPPTQGVSSLMILGLLERFSRQTGSDLREEAQLIHAIVEATKQAFLLRDRFVADPEYMEQTVEDLLDADRLDALARSLSPDRALPWPQPEPEAFPAGGDTVWFGVMDSQGNTVSCIQSLYHEFGSGLVLPGSGIAWHNRGLGFSFRPGTANSLAPGKKPFHTLNPALAVLADGRVLSYGTMGGEGQPQTQAAVFARYALLGYSLQAAVSAPRWLLGRAWGEQSHSLKMEKNFRPQTTRRLKTFGHVVENVPAFSSLMGHAGGLVRYPETYPELAGLLEGAADPRSDGAAACW